MLEIMTGIISTALTTGLVFAKFSRPSAKIIYSKNMLLTNFDGKRVLMFRMANARSNQIISANVELHYLYNSQTAEGIKIVRFAPMTLQKSYSPVFSLSWSVFHTVDESSPLYGLDIDQIHNSRFEFMIVFNGTDGTFSQSIHDVHYYEAPSILKDHHFVDILQRLEDDTRVIDYQKFHQTIPPNA